jgi:NAD(P)-dependent dehydrogenase (short-subunit alcohol dehydrogenase family)
MYQKAEEKFGDKIHVLINNAALFIFKSVEEATAEDWDRTAAVNIKGLSQYQFLLLAGHALMTKHVLPFMKNSKGGSIVFLGSISSYKAQPDCCTYSTIKGA